jgi:hypothetical protein
MDQSFAFAVGAALWAGVCGLAIARGGWPERLAAATTLVGSILTPLVQSRVSGHGEPGIWTVDIICTAIYFYIAMKSDRWWPFFAIAFHLAALTEHAVQATFSPIPLRMYASGEIIWAYLSLFALAAGVLEMEARRRKWPLQTGSLLPT